MSGAQRQPTLENNELTFGPARPAFRRRRRGFDADEVTSYLDMLDRERADLGTALVLTQARVKELNSRLGRYEALEDELTRSLHLAKQTADAVVEDASRRAQEITSTAEAQREAMLADGRARLRAEADELDGMRMALAAEAAHLNSLEERISTHISRAARALVEIVDAPGGLGPFSQATANLLEFAQLLQRSGPGAVPPEAPVPASPEATAATGSPPPPPPPPSAARPAEPGGEVIDVTDSALAKTSG
ncbi:MAG: DivIVA domain-containing protein [Acidimicrobiia bacterium]|nr:DivIVA domain-containing protein [Acidimicrobiia bacterium]